MKNNEKENTAEFRSLLLSFGYDVGDMTDEEIKEGLDRAANELRKVGLTAVEAAARISMEIIRIKINPHNYE